MDNNDTSSKGQDKLNNDPIFNEGISKNITKSAADKVKSSVYLLTINTNKALENLDDLYKTQFKTFVEFLLNKDNLIDNYIIENHGEDPRSIIESVQIEHHYEISPKTNRLHAHGYINIQHNGHIKLNLEDMRALAKKIFNENIYINCSVSSDPSIAMLNYTRKKNQGSADIDSLSPPDKSSPGIQRDENIS